MECGKISSWIIDKKRRRGHLGEICTEAQSNSGIEGMCTYSTVPGLGKQRGKREDTVNMRGRESVGGVQRHLVTGNIMTEEKKEGRPVEFLE